jgi:hypothetical protein
MKTVEQKKQSAIIVEPTIIVEHLKDVPIRINEMTLIARLNKQAFEKYSDYIPKQAKQYKLFKTLINSLEGYSQENNYAALYVEL